SRSGSTARRLPGMKRGPPLRLRRAATLRKRNRPRRPAFSAESPGLGGARSNRRNGMLARIHTILAVHTMACPRTMHQLQVAHLTKAIDRMIAWDRKVLIFPCFSRRIVSVSSLTDGLPHGTA